VSDILNGPFCNLGKRIIKENELAMVFLSNPRVTEGHFLISPKRHVEIPWDLTKDELLAVFELIFEVESKIINLLGTGCDIRQNYRPFMKQSRVKIDHVHFHVIPRTYEDRIYQVSQKHENELWEDLSDEEHDRVARLLQ
jgi:diadenosine tetraphosphate (Ap4A) HIT family hydrolase